MATKPFTMPTREQMRERFAVLQPQLNALEEEMKPLQAEQAEIANYMRERELELDKLLRTKNAARAEISNEMATIVRALSGQTGDPQAVAEEQPVQAE